MKVDMAPEAITRRWRKVAELVQICRALSIKPGSVRPAEDAGERAPRSGNVDPAGIQAGDSRNPQSPARHRQPS